MSLAVLLVIAGVASAFPGHHGRSPIRGYSRGYSQQSHPVPQVAYRLRSYPVVKHEYDTSVERGWDGRLYTVVEHEVERDIEHEYVPYVVHPSRRY